MIDDATIQSLARELHSAEKTRMPVEHFSKRHPAMTIDDGYRLGKRLEGPEVTLFDVHPHHST